MKGFFSFLFGLLFEGNGTDRILWSSARFSSSSRFHPVRCGRGVGWEELDWMVVTAVST